MNLEGLNPRRLWPQPVFLQVKELRSLKQHDPDFALDILMLGDRNTGCKMTPTHQSEQGVQTDMRQN
jgi:hypothetical protein